MFATLVLVTLALLRLVIPAFILFGLRELVDRSSARRLRV